MAVPSWRGKAPSDNLKSLKKLREQAQMAGDFKLLKKLQAAIDSLEPVSSVEYQLQRLLTSNPLSKTPVVTGNLQNLFNQYIANQNSNTYLSGIGGPISYYSRRPTGGGSKMNETNPKFKVGDIVRIVKVATADPEYEKYVGLVVKITEDTDDGEYHYSLDHAPDSWSDDELELVGKHKGGKMFKVGDTVKNNGKGAIGHWTAKLVGEVVKVKGAEVVVLYDKKEADGRGQGPDGNQCGYSETLLELVAPAPKPRAKIKFSSVIIEDGKRDQILEALEQVNQSKLIFDEWGFGDTMEKGKGVSMLFWGPPGTGKTLMAQAIGDHIKKKLKIVGVADIESSAPGESERNIRKIFAEAKKSGDVLLFDECDSLIYNRAQVGAILGAQINELLSQLERHEGVTLFTTNRLGILDEAMNRRLALKLEFGMPTLEQRVKIWQRMFPKKAPVEKGINWLKLAKVEIAGGYIKNTVLRAARMAAIQKIPDKEKQITMEHLVKSLQLEAQSMLEFDEARRTEERPAMVRDYVQSKSLERASAW